MTQVRPTNLGHFRALLDWRWRKCARVEGLTMSRRYCGVGLGLTVKQKR